jgi:hypothetical protein
MPLKRLRILKNAVDRLRAGYENQPEEGRPAPEAFSRIVKSKVGREPILLLTGTVDPQGMIGTQLIDPRERENDYLSAFEKWVKLSNFKKIIFCENSGYDLSKFAKIEHGSKEVHLLCFKGNDFDRKHGKGFGEMEILAHVFKQPGLVTHEDRIVKCTGRLFVKNHRSFYDHALSSRFDISADLYRSLDECDVRLFMFSSYFYRYYLQERQSLLNETVHPAQLLEKIVAQAICCAAADLLQFKPLPATPRFDGRSGSSNYRYGFLTTALGRMLKAIPPRRL